MRINWSAKDVVIFSAALNENIQWDSAMEKQRKQQQC